MKHVNDTRKFINAKHFNTFYDTFMEFMRERQYTIIISSESKKIICCLFNKVILSKSKFYNLNVRFKLTEVV